MNELFKYTRRVYQVYLLVYLVKGLPETDESEGGEDDDDEEEDNSSERLLMEAREL